MTDTPRFRPWLRPVARRQGGIQFGMGPAGVILEGLTATEASLLAGLDGTLTRRATFERARRVGVSSARWRELLEVLERLDVIDDQRGRPDPVARIAGQVLVDGAGELARECALLLRRCGVERVSHGRTAVDVALAAPQAPQPDLVVVVGDHALDPRRGDVWLRRRVPHLAVIASGDRAQVGPLLAAGPLTPCLWCLDLHRTDRDDEWPTLMAQLCRADGSTLTGYPVPDELPAGLVHLVSGVVSLYAVGLLTGEHPPEGVSAEMSLPWPRMDHRRWPRHPRCDRHVRARSVVA